MKTSIRRHLRHRRKFSIKKKIQAHSGKLRLTVFRSAKHIYAQIVDDEQRNTLASESTASKAFQKQMKYGGNVKAAALVGSLLGEEAAKQGIQQVVYDRNGYVYTGRVKALADAVREKGVKF